MKNTFAVFLFICVFVYHFGYQAAYFSQYVRVERVWSEKIYSGTPLHLEERVLEIPISVAYMPDQEFFQEANTTFEQDGQVFRIVKQRYHRDTLQIIYVPDKGREALRQLITVWATTQSGEDTSPEGITLMKPTFKPYIQEPYGALLCINLPVLLNKVPVGQQVIACFVDYSQVSPPPEVLG